MCVLLILLSGFMFCCDVFSGAWSGSVAAIDDIRWLCRAIALLNFKDAITTTSVSQMSNFPVVRWATMQLWTILDEFWTILDDFWTIVEKNTSETDPQSVHKCPQMLFLDRFLDRYLDRFLDRFLDLWTIVDNCGTKASSAEPHDRWRDLR